jgi:hypothetical protein
MRTRIPRIIAEVNQVIADHANADTKLEREALHLRMLGQARAKATGGRRQGKRKRSTQGNGAEAWDEACRHA